MIACVFHKGSGVGNQLHRYVAARVIAKDKGYDFGVCLPENSKMDFMNLDMGVPVHDLLHEFNERRVDNKDGVDIRGFDYNIAYIKDYTLIDGEFQHEDYFNHRYQDIEEWLKVDPIEMPDDVVAIGFRGGEYVGVKDLFLNQEYWDKAISMFKGKRFEVHTDDPETARKFFPEFPIIHNVGVNWRSIRYAKNLIIANSSFYILPSLLGGAQTVIAPKYWARPYGDFWATNQNNYKRFTYV
jgi:hypothetical protein